MLGSKSKYLFDCIIVTLEICMSISIVMQLYYIPGLGYWFPLTIILLIAHFIRFRMSLDIINIILANKLLGLIILIKFFDFFQCWLFRKEFDLILTTLLSLINSFFFLSYLYNMYMKSSKPFDYVVKPYLGYSLYNIVTIVIVTFLILARLPWMMNPLSSNIGILAEDIEGGGLYFFPYFLSVAAEYHHYAIWGGLPGLTGLSHEPHVIMFIITPAFFFLFKYKHSVRVRTFLIVSYLFIWLNSFSTMSMLCVLAVYFLHLLWLGLRRRKFSYLLMSITVVGLVYFIWHDTIDFVLNIIDAKTKNTDSTSSLTDSSNMLKYILSFNGFLSYGNYAPKSGFHMTNESAGFVTGILDVYLYLLMIINSIKLAFSRINSYHYVGLGFIYFLIHGFKLGSQIFAYPFFTYMVFLHYLSKQCTKKRIDV